MMEEHGSDAEIMAAAVGAPMRFGVIFERYYRPIRAYLGRRVGADLADELAAEAFVIAFRRRADFDPSRRSAAPWLFGIATNLVSRQRRDERRRILAYARLQHEAEPDPAAEVVARADAKGRAKAIARALAELEAADRDVLLLHALAELSYREIAEAIEIPIGTVRSRLHRARGQLRELLCASGQGVNESEVSSRG